jgi:SNF family Na+-dependent transporter
MSHTTGIQIKDIPISGLELAFVAYPALLTQLPGANLWAIVFFLMLVTVGIDSMFASVDYNVTLIFLILKSKIVKYEIKRFYVTIAYCVVLCFLSMMYATKAGLHIFAFFDHFAVGIGNIFFLFFQSIIIGWWFGF